ncbi:DHA2 family efflux MFS transporter permease subunit [Jiangella aurantiaca]|uniref:DHA2 family efflux MFS transporter permease subunit n=1 Tax=Jiangella aurantiaca TaxID=2530373 RepID=A0A4R5ANJ5_9ACTN|nr:MFS transporter [Jiangella aurantiaca]TDD72604.1 DHA2 family efflux MFS transporter permease subunit [Jiangella aurantiaca]
MVQVVPDPRRWKALALLCGAFFMVILDSAIVVVALPSIETDLGFAPRDLQWVLSAYALTFGGLLLLGGRSADLVGRRRMFMIGLALFTVASLLCALAWSPAALIVARAFQGVGAAVLTPTALSIVTTTFAEGPERNKALGIWGALGGVGGTAGWLIGGPLTDISWEWIFLINLPIGATALALAPRLLRESRAVEQRRGFDPLGALAATAALVLLVYGVVEAPEAGWGDPQTVGLLVGSAVLFVLFAVVESRVAAPLLPLRILRSWTLVGANVTMLLFSTIGFGMPFILTLYAQQVLGYSAVKFGLTSIVFPLAVTVAAIAGQGLVLKIGFRVVATAGLALLGIGCLYLTQVSAGGSYFGDIFLGLLICGLGVGLTFVTCSIAALAGVDEREAGLASGLSNTTFQIGAAVGTAIVSTVAVSRTNDVIAGGGDPLGAVVEGHQAGFLACVVLAGVGVVSALLLLRRPPALGPDHPPLVPVAEQADD